jgi:hypothetical protein
MTTDAQPIDIFFNLFTALFSAVGLTICLFFFLIAVAIFIWWLYSNFYSEKIYATIVGIRAYQKDTTIEDGKEIKTKPYDMYSPLLLCKFESGAVANGKLSSNQNWIPEKWIIGSKIRVSKSQGMDNFNETAGSILFLSSLAIGFASLAFAYSIKINIYVIAILGIFLLKFLFKIYRNGFLGKTYDFIVNHRWKELEQGLPSSRRAFFQRKKEEEKNTSWYKLSPEEISGILEKQYNNFFRGTLPFMLILSSGMLAIAYYKFGKKLVHSYMDGVQIIDIAHKNPTEFAMASSLAIFGAFIFLQITTKAIRLFSKKNATQQRIF